MAATLKICADDEFRLFVNGRLIGEEKQAGRVTNTWGPGRFYCVPTVTMTF